MKTHSVKSMKSRMQIEKGIWNELGKRNLMGSRRQKNWLKKRVLPTLLVRLFATLSSRQNLLVSDLQTRRLL